MHLVWNICEHGKATVLSSPFACVLSSSMHTTQVSGVPDVTVAVVVVFSTLTVGGVAGRAVICGGLNRFPVTDRKFSSDTANIANRSASRMTELAPSAALSSPPRLPREPAMHIGQVENLGFCSNALWQSTWNACPHWYSWSLWSVRCSGREHTAHCTAVTSTTSISVLGSESE